MPRYAYSFSRLTDSLENVPLRFMSFNYTDSHGGVNPSAYFISDSGTLSADSPLAACEKLYRIYNTNERPAHYHGPCMSVSDIVIICDSSVEPPVKTMWYCDRIGFAQINDDGKAVNTQIY